MRLEDNKGLDDTLSGPIEVAAVLPGGPAFESGKVSVGDILLTVDGRTISNFKVDDVRKLIVGPSNTPVTVRVVSFVCAARVVSFVCAVRVVSFVCARAR